MKIIADDLMIEKTKGEEGLKPVTRAYLYVQRFTTLYNNAMGTCRLGYERVMAGSW